MFYTIKLVSKTWRVFKLCLRNSESRKYWSFGSYWRELILKCKKMNICNTDQYLNIFFPILELILKIANLIRKITFMNSNNPHNDLENRMSIYKTRELWSRIWSIFEFMFIQFLFNLVSISAEWRRYICYVLFFLVLLSKDYIYVSANCWSMLY